MEYEFELTVPAGTTKASPAKTTCQLTKGIIHQYSIAFLEGCNNLVSIAVFEGGFQCFPINPDGAIKGNAEAVNKSTYYPLLAAPYKLAVKGWAPDCTYDHTIQFRVDVLPEAYFDKDADNQVLIDTIEAIKEGYETTSGEIADQLAGIAAMIFPSKTPAEPEPEAEASEIPEETPEDILEELNAVDRARIEAMVRIRYSDDDILFLFRSREDLPPDQLRKAIAAARELQEVS